ncbi:oxidoreductase [Thermonema rossianum]|uniref:oxidoreductase n=1 Tax=Thermonema rossianum TaxID=55505 RepID=UPI00056F0915|nr:oxidoreductase [Thermonema rossianum]
MENKQAAVAGATGLTGSYLCQLLGKSDAYAKVWALVRRETDLPQGVSPLLVDWEHIEATPPDAPLDEAFCCLGTTMKKAGSKEAFRKVDHDYVLAFARWAYAHGCRRFFAVTAMGADKRSVFFYNRVKGEVEEALAQIGFESLYIFRPSLLLGQRHESRPAEQISARLSAFFRPLIPLRYRPVEAGRVAWAMYRCAQNPEKGKFIIENDQILKLSS